MTQDEDELLAELRAAWADSASSAKPATEALDAAQGGEAPGLERYRIVRRLGEGGMGVVYEAEQRSPRRRVALKVLRAGLTSERALHRFRLEAELLGRLDHPGIARIVEAGSFGGPHGEQPFYAMELVPGEPIVEHAERRGLGLEARLELFALVGDAVHHAHQKGVLHRDLKPGNVLVDEAGRPRVLDFGVACAIDRDAQTARATQPGQLVGTFAYMSPEQIAGRADDLDTRSDVYALGVLLYELLAGQLPHPHEKKSLATLAREVQEDDPPRLGALRPELRGDLDAIVGKALEKDRERRYDSAAALVADVRRFLRHEPVTARRPSAAYQLGRFARRNRALMAAVATIALLLVAGIVTASVLAVRARRAERVAAQRLERAETVQAFLEEILVHADPGERWGPEPTARDVLASAARRIEERLAGQPAVEASVRHVVGRAFLSLGALDQAEEHLARALALRAEAGEPDVDDARVPDALADLAETRGDERAAEPLRRRAVEAARALPGGEHLLAACLGRLSGNLLMQGRLGEAEEVLREAERVRAAAPPAGAPESPSFEGELLHVAHLLAARGRMEEATSVLRHGIELQERVAGPRHAGVAEGLTRLASMLREQGDAAGAEAAARDALDIYAQRLEAHHPRVVDARMELGLALRLQGRLDEAADELGRALEDRERVSGARRSAGALLRASLGNVLGEMGRHEEGEALLREALDDFTAEHGERTLDAIRTRQQLSSLLHQRGRTEEALLVVTPAVHAARDAYPGSRWQAKIVTTRAWYLGSLGRHAEAEPLFLEVRRLVEEGGGELDDLRELNLASLVQLYGTWGRQEEAERWAAELSALRSGGGERP